MKGKATIKDVANAAGVSTGLASMIINGNAPTKCKRKDAVIKAVQDLHYIPNKSAAELRKGIRKKIAVITPDLSNHYFSEISRQIENIAYDNGYIVLFGSSDDSPKKFSSLVQTFIRDGVSGLVLTPCEGVSETLRQAAGMRIPTVLMNRDLDGVGKMGKVFLDNDKAIKMGLDFLHGKGYSKVAMVTDDAGISTQIFRETSYTAYMKQGGREPAIERVSRSIDIPEIMKAVSRLHDSGSDAILVPKGHLTLHVYKAIKKLGLRIPEDMALVGFDGGVAYNLVSPTITQINQSTRDTAEESFRLILELIKNQENAKTILLEPTIAEAEST